MIVSGTIPLDKIEKIQIYPYRFRSTKSGILRVLKNTGGDIALTGTIFLRSLSPCTLLKVNGCTKTDLGYSERCISWNNHSDFGLKIAPNNDANYMQGINAIVNRKPVEPIPYHSDMGGARRRVFIGTKDGRFAYYGNSSNVTPEYVRDTLISCGWDNAVMMDGGGSAFAMKADGTGFAGDGRILPWCIVVTLKKENSKPTCCTQFKWKTKEAVLQIAEWQVGVVESPKGSNKTKYGRLYGLDGYPWCVMFVWWVFNQAGFNLHKTASCTQLMNEYKKHGQWVTNGFKTGDIVLFDFSGKKRKTEHCGIVYEVQKDKLITIEGNTGKGNEANGGAVMMRVRSLKDVTGACRPNYNM